MGKMREEGGFLLVNVDQLHTLWVGKMLLLLDELMVQYDKCEINF